MKRALLVLTATEPAIFSERAATEGTHRSRLAPTGSALLGWAAGRLYGQLEAKGAAFKVFHSGTVRFSDGLHLMGPHAAYPTPRVLFASKTGKDSIENRIKNKQAWVGRPAFQNDLKNKNKQPEAIDRPLLTLGLDMPGVETGGRLRTATEAGHAREGALFGFSHLEPGSPDHPARFAATLEADDLDEEGWSELKGAFDGQTLRLGRAASSGYGGWYACKWFDRGHKDFADVWRPAVWPIGPDDPLVRVWVLSDLALFDGNGAPLFEPAVRDLGLPLGGQLDRTESSVAMRRFAPWNRHLNCRDVERQVIAAGSVLSYRYNGGAPAMMNPPALAGVFQEQGLGRIWINCPLLRGTYPQAIEQATITPTSMGAEDAIPATTRDEGLFEWARTMLRHREDDRRAETWASDWRKARWDTDDLPSRSQWSALLRVVRMQQRVDDMLTHIFGAADQHGISKVWKKKAGVWLEGKIREAAADISQDQGGQAAPDGARRSIAQLRRMIHRLAEEVERMQRADGRRDGAAIESRGRIDG